LFAVAKVMVVVVQNKCHTKCKATFVICYHKNLHIPGANVSLVIANRLKAKCRSRVCVLHHN